MYLYVKISPVRFSVLSLFLTRTKKFPVISFIKTIFVFLQMLVQGGLDFKNFLQMLVQEGLDFLFSYKC